MNRNECSQCEGLEYIKERVDEINNKMDRLNSSIYGNGDSVMHRLTSLETTVKFSKYLLPIVIGYLTFITAYVVKNII